MKILKRIYNWFIKPMEDRNKILAKIASLNTEKVGDNWVDLNGFNAITTMNYLPNGTVAYNPNLGFPIKVFLNLTNGEIRIFDASLFKV